MYDVLFYGDGFPYQLDVLCADVDLRLYVVPTEDSSLGNFLALADPWYRKQVPAPLSFCVLIPCSPSSTTTECPILYLGIPCAVVKLVE
jgi:hypothetical protein